MTEGNQGAAEWLRGIVGEYDAEKSTASCTFMAKLLGIECGDVTCRECMAKMMTTIADRIDAERALPEGIEWPRFEDGELVKVGDTVGSDEPFTAKEIAFESERWLIKASSRSAFGFFHGDFGDPVKRPTPEVLDADGKPIEVGDTVYCDGEDEALTVTSISGVGVEYCCVTVKNADSSHCTVDAPRLTHERPDSWERLEEDMMRGTSCRYFGGVESAAECWDCPHGTDQTGTPCWKNERIDILKRAKKLAGIEEGARND